MTTSPETPNKPETKKAFLRVENYLSEIVTIAIVMSVTRDIYRNGLLSNLERPEIIPVGILGALGIASVMAKIRNRYKKIIKNDD